MPAGSDSYNPSDSYNASSQDLHPSDNLSSFEDFECGVVPDIERIKVGSCTESYKLTFTQVALCLEIASLILPWNKSIIVFHLYIDGLFSNMFSSN